MITMYLPTIDHSLWPCVGLLIVFIPVSIWHEAAWRRTLAAYAVERRAAGASDEPWPSTGLKRTMSLQPWLILVAAALLAMMVALGTTALLAWPHKLAYFDEVLNYFDRPYLTAMLVAGTAAVVGAVALAIDLSRSPWQRVAARVRRATHAPQAAREACFSAALKVDPGVPAN